jgi:hypothetical protein
LTGERSLTGLAPKVDSFTDCFGDKREAHERPQKDNTLKFQ